MGFICSLTLLVSNGFDFATSCLEIKVWCIHSNGTVSLISQMSFGGETSGFMKSGLFPQVNGSLSAKVTKMTGPYLLALIVQKVDNTISIGFPNVNPQNSDLSIGLSNV